MEAGRPRTGKRWGWAAALAAAIVMGVAVPLLLGVFRQEPAAGFFRPQFVGQSELGQGDRNVVTLRDGEARWTAYFPLDASAGDFPCTVELVNDRGSSIVRTTVGQPEELAGGQYLFLECARRHCPPGSYALRIESSSGRQLETIAFRVEPR